MILTDHIDISTAFLHSRPSKRPCKVFQSFGFALVDIEAIGETVYVKNCLHVMIYVQKVVANFAFISQVSFNRKFPLWMYIYKRLQILFLQYAGMKCSV